MIIDCQDILNKIPDFLKGKKCDIEAVTNYITRMLTHLAHKEKMITEAYVSDMALWVQKRQSPEAYYTYKFFETYFVEIQEYLDQSKTAYDNFKKAPEHLNAEIVPGCNDYIKKLLDRKKAVMDSIKKR